MGRTDDAPCEETYDEDETVRHDGSADRVVRHGGSGEHEGGFGRVLPVLQVVGRPARSAWAEPAAPAGLPCKRVPFSSSRTRTGPL